MLISHLLVYCSIVKLPGHGKVLICFHKQMKRCDEEEWLSKYKCFRKGIKALEMISLMLQEDDSGGINR